MYIPEFNKNKMQVNVIWTFDASVLNVARYTKWLSGVQRRYRSIEYTDNTGKGYRGFIQNNLSSNESFAVYVKEMYGDGFYYSPVTENDMTIGIYLLIIKNDVIYPGTDSVFSAQFFRRIDEARNQTDFADLPRVELGTRYFDEISETYKKNVLVMRRKKITGYIMFVFFLVIFFTFFYFAIDFFILG